MSSRPTGTGALDTKIPKRLCSSAKSSISSERCALFAIVLCALGCDEPAPQPRTPPARRAVVALRPTATATSFDLIVTSQGPLLVYGQPMTTGGAIMALPLTRTGDAARAERVVAQHGDEVQTDAMELAAAAGGGRVIIAWVWRNAAVMRAVATFGDASVEAFAPPRTLSAVEFEGRATHRGLVAVAASPSGEVSVVHRGERGPCAVGRGNDCAAIAVTRLAPGETERGGVPLALPEPCRRTVVGYEYAGGVWYYGLCDQSELATTMLFAIQFEPRYAHAERALNGCEPLGLTVLGDRAVALGDCDGVIQGMAMGQAGRELTEFTGAPAVDCDGDKPRIAVAGQTLTLDAPRDGLELLLGPPIATRTARAVWTGEAILVAAPVGGEVGLQRWECIDGQLRRTDRE